MWYDKINAVLSPFGIIHQSIQTTPDGFFKLSPYSQYYYYSWDLGVRPPNSFTAPITSDRFFINSPITDGLQNYPEFPPD